MFRKVLSLNIEKSVCFLRNASTAAKSKDKWDIYAGVLVERTPIITKPLKPLEQQFQDHLNQIEFENSLKSDHELRHEKNLAQAELIRKGEIDVDTDVDNTNKQTAQDMKDAWKEEFSKFTLAPRKTAADASNDTKSTNRKLEETLILLVAHQLGQEKHLLLPQGRHTAGETLRQTAERVLREKCGDKLDVLFYGNSPCGFYKFKYPADKRTEAVGAKVFFFRSVLKAGEIADANIQYEWLDKTEIEPKFKKPYFQSVSQFLL